MSKTQGFASCPENINKKGRPPRGWTWADIFEQEVEKRGDKDKKVIKKLMVNKMIDKVVKEGDVQAFKEIANRMDGLPKQALDLTTDGKRIGLFNYIKQNEDRANDSNNKIAENEEED